MAYMDRSSISSSCSYRLSTSTWNEQTILSPLSPCHHALNHQRLYTLLLWTVWQEKVKLNTQMIISVAPTVRRGRRVRERDPVCTSLSSFFHFLFFFLVLKGCSRLVCHALVISSDPVTKVRRCVGALFELSVGYLQAWILWERERERQREGGARERERERERERAISFCLKHVRIIYFL